MAKLDENAVIGVLSHTHPDLTKGGAEISAYSVFQGLKTLGYKAVFIYVHKDTDIGRLEPVEDEVGIVFDPAEYDFFYHIGPAGLEQKLRAVIKDRGITVLNLHHYLNFGINTFGMLQDLDIPQYATLHEYLAICQHHGQMVTNPDRVLCRQASRLRCQTCFPERFGEEFDLRRDTFQSVLGNMAGYIAPSKFLADRYIDWGMSADKMHVIENGLLAQKVGTVDESLTPTATETRAASLGSDTDDRPFVLGYFGQITPFKGVDVLLDALEVLSRKKKYKSRIRLRVHGNLVGMSESFTKRFDALIATGLVEYLGPYDNSDVRNLMRNCDYVVIPSRWWENSPVVIQEAYAAGRPLIASNIGGLAEKVVDGKTGLHFQVGNANSLANTLKAACAPDIHAELCENLPKVLSSEDMARAYLDVMSG